MNFRTIVELPIFDFKINHSDKCIFIGSCFSENIGAKLLNTKIPTLVNPTGIHYNPYSICNTVESIINLAYATSDNLFHSNGLWYSYSFHSKFSDTNKVKTSQNINDAIFKANSFLKSCKYLFITFGTSYIYVSKENDLVVSNCHRQPSGKFDRKFLEPQDTYKLWVELIEKLQTFNPNLKIIFTVSPVRHWKDGATNNMYSKASLHLAISKLITAKCFSGLYYFPAYEIVNDELRDYRFYADDMLHPSTSAIEYIWERFCNSFFLSETIELNKKIDKIIRASQHRPFNKNTNEYKQFCSKILDDISNIENQYPYMDFSEEKGNFF